LPPRVFPFSFGPQRTGKPDPRTLLKLGGIARALLPARVFLFSVRAELVEASPLVQTTQRRGIANEKPGDVFVASAGLVV
jgi:hypothetical protein